MAKYKLKTHSGTKRRIAVSGSGKLLRGKAHQSHLRRKKPKSVKRQYSDLQQVSPADVKKLKRLLPY